MHRRDAGGEQALALAREGLDRAVIQREAALGLHRVADPVLAARELLALRQEDGPDRIPLEQPCQVARALSADDGRGDTVGRGLLGGKDLRVHAAGPFDADRKSTRLNSKSPMYLVCRLLL